VSNSNSRSAGNHKPHTSCKKEQAIGQGITSRIPPCLRCAAVVASTHTVVMLMCNSKGRRNDSAVLGRGQGHWGRGGGSSVRSRDGWATARLLSRERQIPRRGAATDGPRRGSGGLTEAVPAEPSCGSPADPGVVSLMC
jgi:hypothetical protein